MLWDLEKIRAISFIDKKHVFIAGTWTGIHQLSKGKEDTIPGAVVTGGRGTKFLENCTRNNSDFYENL